MSEVIDLEDLDYESVCLPEDYPEARKGSAADSLTDGNTSQQSQTRLIMIKSYTEICFEAGESAGQEETSPRVKSNKFTETNNNATLTEPLPDKKRKFSRPMMKFPKSKDKVNVWTKQKNGTVKKRNRIPCWLAIFAFCCGVSKDYQWYSLMGKGVILAIFMFILYLVACLVFLPFVMIAGAVSAVFFAAGMVSYFAFSSKKVGVSFDDDGEASCLKAVWGSWV
ncbi:hypothetical protein P5673_000088 [Acropora cervicornis]|uniref:Uncharacterized protein n=1 Tax=Acropora cervicornis TaxID=6130 RepID=A0AAD9VHD8_ACRCE|nr:PREDICTED: uncharacterized protein LOC107355114 [Acropora digitifera]XP_015777223.1 PREDICTED: uncharacterized protein LOC107355114 [Acropora digitifera]KAK2573977.1 hypothetical protein P5673_000088 [Acropora cervicornis]